MISKLRIRQSEAEPKWSTNCLRETNSHYEATLQQWLFVRSKLQQVFVFTLLWIGLVWKYTCPATNQRPKPKKPKFRFTTMQTYSFKFPPECCFVWIFLTTQNKSGAMSNAMLVGYFGGFHSNLNFATLNGCSFG